MTRLIHFALLISLGFSAQAQEVLTFGSAVTGTIVGGESRILAFTAEAGEEISGHAELLGPEGTLQFLDANGNRVAGLKVRSWFLGGTGGRRVGFIAPSAGRYQLRITAGSVGRRGAYTLRLERRTVTARMRGVPAAIAKEINASERVKQLSRDVQEGRHDAVDQFWREVAGKGPLIESIDGNQHDLLVTFLWRETYETHNVLLGWPMAAWRADDYYMSRLPNTDVWYKTIQVRKGSRFLYWFSPNLRNEADRLFTDELDPLNSRVFPEDPNSSVDLGSVLETPGAPDESWSRRTPARRGAVEHQKLTFKLLEKDSEMWLYTPPGYTAAAEPYPLLILLDGAMYVRPDFNNAPATLDNLINDGRIRPAVVCFVDSLFRTLSPGNPHGDAIAAYGDAIARELLPRLRATYRVSASAEDTVIGGLSAGGLVASLIALRHSDVFGSVLSQSGFFRARKQGSDEPTSVAQLYRDAPRLPLRFYLETGLYENVPSARLPLHEMSLDEGITASNRHFRDVLLAKGYRVTYQETGGGHETLHWRATLADALIDLLKPRE